MDPTQDAVRERFSYAEFGEGVRTLHQRVLDDEWVPDTVLGIVRGGLFLAAGLAYAFSCKDLRTINVEFYTDIGTTLDDPVLVGEVPHLTDLAGKRVLIADDVADSGRTLAYVADLLPRGAQVRTAVLYGKPRSVIKPDYVWRQTERWIVFPWAPPAADR